MPSTSYTNSQKQAFAVATSFSKQVGIPIGLALNQIDRFLPELRRGVADIREAHAQLGEVISTIEKELKSLKFGAKAILGVVMTVDPQIEYLIRVFVYGLAMAREAQRVLESYKNDLESVLQNGNNIRALLKQRAFAYQSGTGPAKHNVDSCVDLRRFDRQVNGMGDHLGQIAQEMLSVRKTLDFYGSDAGKQRRNQTKQLMTNVKLTINAMVSALTDVMRTSWIDTLRIAIDAMNGSNCGKTGGTKYIGPRTEEGLWDRSNYVPMTVEDHANDCDGLNKLSGLMRRMADVEGLTWTQYRQRWNRWSKDKREYQILLAFKRVRKKMENMRDRDIPNGRDKFVDAFRGMSKVLGRGGPGIGLSQSEINTFGPLPKAYLSLNAAFGNAIRIRMQAVKAEPLLTTISEPSNVSCQSTSNYSAILGLGEGGEPLNSMWVVSGGFAAGVAIAHFFPNLLR